MNTQMSKNISITQSDCMIVVQFVLWMEIFSVVNGIIGSSTSGVRDDPIFMDTDS